MAPPLRRAARQFRPGDAPPVRLTTGIAPSACGAGLPHRVAGRFAIRARVAARRCVVMPRSDSHPTYEPLTQCRCGSRLIYPTAVHHGPSGRAFVERRAPGMRGSRHRHHGRRRSHGLDAPPVSNCAPSSRHLSSRDDANRGGSDRVCPARIVLMRVMQMDAVGAPLRLADRPIPEPAPGQVCFVSAPAGSAGPTCTCSTARSIRRACRGCSATRSSAVVHGRQARSGLPWLGWTCGTCR